VQGRRGASSLDFFRQAVERGKENGQWPGRLAKDIKGGNWRNNWRKEKKKTATQGRKKIKNSLNNTKRKILKGGTRSPLYRRFDE